MVGRTYDHFSFFSVFLSPRIQIFLEAGYDHISFFPDFLSPRIQIFLEAVIVVVVEPQVVSVAV